MGDLKATITRSTARVGQPRLVIETTPEKVSLRFNCGKCKRRLVIDPDEKLTRCSCGTAVATALLLEMAEATLEYIRGTVCAIAGRDDYLEAPEPTNSPDEPDDKKKEE